MKKYICILIVFTLVFALFVNGCGKENMESSISAVSSDLKNTDDVDFPDELELYLTNKDNYIVGDGYCYTAMCDYSDDYEENNADKTAAFNYALVLMYIYGDYYTANEVLLTAYTEEELTSAADAEVIELYKTTVRFSNTHDYAYSIYTNASSDSSVTYDDCVAELEKIIGENNYSDSFTYYYEYFFAALYGESFQTQYECLNKIYNSEDPMSYAFASTLCSLYRSYGYFDQANKLAELCISYNAEDYYAYSEMGYCALLQNDFLNGSIYISRAYELNQEKMYNAMLIFYIASGDAEAYETLAASVEEQGFEIDEGITEYAAGSVNLENLLMNV